MNSSEGKSEVCLTCEFQENLDILRETYFFSALSLELLKLMAYLCSREIYKAGDYLFSQGDDDGQAFYILSGKTRLIHSKNGMERVVREYGKEAFLGGMALVGNIQRLFSLQAISDTACLVLTRDKFSKAMEQFPEQMPKIVKALVERICNWEERFLVEISENCEACRTKIGISLI
ncbi:MAG: cyclic nucleotide-binding domain-containing protein [Deltaproteobacteria bacterium]|nr:cyclic nucleotide-binding domain-containing protein [Deltaproteobacteria bacterium]